jgi:hypothetical protein
LHKSTRKKRLGVVGLVLLSLGAGSPPARASENPRWAKRAIALDLSCPLSPNVNVSPDKQYSVEVVCHRRKEDDPTYSLRVRTGKGTPTEVPLDEGAHELLWAPNSRAFFVDGATTAYAGFFVSVYQLTPRGRIDKRIVTSAAQGDMVASFPPCKASNHDEAACHRIETDPEYNMSGVGWTGDSSAVNVVAEVPCSSSYGGIMCQVNGYEISVPDGRIQKRLAATEVSLQWRDMAWTLHIPDPPSYGPPQHLP